MVWRQGSDRVELWCATGLVPQTMDTGTRLDRGEVWEKVEEIDTEICVY